MFTIQAREVTRLSVAPNVRPEETLANYLRQHVRLATCETIHPPTALESYQGYVRVEWRWQCPKNKLPTIHNTAFFELNSQHVHFARAYLPNEQRLEFIFSKNQHNWALTTAENEVQSVGHSLFDYLRLGIEHILIGIDHIAFLLGLMLICRHLHDVVIVVTGFTLGHSLTLGIAALGWFRPDIQAIEALIGLTIALVAAEKTATDTDKLSAMGWVAALTLLLFALLAILGAVQISGWIFLGFAIFSYCYFQLIAALGETLKLHLVMTMLFGLIHGFGFANVLIELNLETPRLMLVLFGFNLGVEIGQLLIIAMLFASLWGLKGFIQLPKISQTLASAGLCGLGMFWLTVRSF